MSEMELVIEGQENGLIKLPVTIDILIKIIKKNYRYFGRPYPAS